MKKQWGLRGSFVTPRTATLLSWGLMNMLQKFFLIKCLGFFFSSETKADMQSVGVLGEAFGEEMGLARPYISCGWGAGFKF